MRTVHIYLLLVLFVVCSCAPSTPEVIRETVIVEVTKEVVITAIPEPLSTPTPEPAVIFEDDFESGDGDWQIFSDSEGYVKIQDGEYVFSVKVPNLTFYGGNPNLDYLDDYAMDFDINFISGPMDSVFNIEFNTVSDETYHGIGIDAEGYAHLYVVVDGEFDEILPWARHNAIKIGKVTNHIRLVDDDIRISFYVNNELLFSLPLEYTSRGFLYFSVNTWDEGGATWSVDNVKVTEL